MGDLIRVKRGLKANLPELMQGEIGFVTDEEEVYIGGVNGNVSVGNTKEFKDHLIAYKKDLLKVFNVEGYGAVADYNVDTGVGTDNTISFVNAFTDALTNGGIVYIPEGKYLVSAKIASITSKVRVMGDGRWASRIYYSGTDNLIELSTAQYFSIDHVSLYYVGLSTTCYAIKDLAPYSGYTINSKELYIQDFPFGVKLKKVTFSEMDVIIASVNKAVQIGFDLSTDSGDYANNFKLSIAPTNCNVGLKLGNGVNIKIHDKGFQGSINSGIQFSANSSGISSSIEFDNVYFEELSPTIASLDGTAGRNQMVKFNNCYFACNIIGKFKGFKELVFNNCTSVDSVTTTNLIYIENCSNVDVKNSNITLRTYGGRIINKKRSVPQIGNLARKSNEIVAGSNWIFTGASAVYPSDEFEGTPSTKIVITTSTMNIANRPIVSSSGVEGYNWFGKQPIGVSFDIKASKTVRYNGYFQAGANFITTPQQSLTTEWQHFSSNFIPGFDLSDATQVTIGLQIAAFDGTGVDVYICNFRVWYGQLEAPNNFVENTDNRVMLNRPKDLIVPAVGDVSGMYFRAGDTIRKSVVAGTVLDKMGWIVKQGGCYFGTLPTRLNSTAYNEGDIVRTHGTTTDYVAVCIKSGVSGASLGAIAGENTFLSDGSAIWWLIYYGTTAVISDLNPIV